MTKPAKLSSADIDRLSLEQALIDAEVAIGRSRDLALRLVELRDQLAQEREANIQLRQEVVRVQGLYEEIARNRAYGMATKIWAVRRAFGAE